MSRGIRVTTPLVLGPDSLHATDVPENDHPVWSSGTSYTLGQRVIKNHTIWEAAQNHSGQDPEQDLSMNYWLRVGPTNRWRAFQPEQVTSTHKANDLYFEFNIHAAFNTVHIFGLIDAKNVRITVTDSNDNTVYDSGSQAAGRVLRNASFWEFYFAGNRQLTDTLHFYGLPPSLGSRLRIEMTGGANLGVQAIVVGSLTEFGLGVQYGAEVGVQSFSVVTRDKWGIATLRKGNYIKTLRGQVLVKRSQMDRFVRFLSDADSQVRVWDMCDDLQSTKVLGLVSRWNSLIEYPQHTMFSLEIEGMAIK